MIARILWLLVFNWGLLVIPAWGQGIAPCPPGTTCPPPGLVAPTLFALGSTVQVSVTTLSVFQSPAGVRAGTAPLAARALIIGGPTTLADTSVWYQMAFVAGGLIGWAQSTGVTAVPHPVLSITVTPPPCAHDPSPCLDVIINGVLVP